MYYISYLKYQHSTGSFCHWLTKYLIYVLYNFVLSQITLHEKLTVYNYHCIALICLLKLRACRYIMRVYYRRYKIIHIFHIPGYQQGYGYEYGSPYQSNRPVYPPYGPEGDRYNFCLLIFYLLSSSFFFMV